jgi:predicted AAA+ superfamily ATPase
VVAGAAGQVLTIGATRVPIEVKYRRAIDPQSDTEGLRSFIEKTHYRASFGILITQDEKPVVRDPRIVVLPLASFLTLR